VAAAILVRINFDQIGLATFCGAKFRPMISGRMARWEMAMSEVTQQTIALWILFTLLLLLPWVLD
jgi:hypothetical protein